MRKLNVFFGLLVACSVFCVLCSTPSWGAVSLDSLANDITALKISVAGLTAEIGSLRTIMVSFFTVLFAAMIGLFIFVFNISMSLRVPKEERVSKMEVFMEKMLNWIPQVNEKLHLPKMALLLLIVSLCSVFCVLCSTPSWGVPMQINVQGRLADASGVRPMPQPSYLRFCIYQGGTSDPGTGTLVFGQNRTVTYNAAEAGPARTYIGPTGIFDVILEAPGDTGDVPNFDTTQNYWLEVRPDTLATPLTPRQKIVAVPMAITAKNVRGGTVVASSADFAITGTGTGASGIGVYGESPYRAGRFVGTGTNGVGVSAQGAVFGGAFTSTAAGSIALQGSATDVNSGVGIHGAGATAGGSFESSGAGSIAVRGNSTNTTSGIGVYGKGATAGGSFEATSTGGVGVYATGEAFGGKFNGNTQDGVYGTSNGMGRGGFVELRIMLLMVLLGSGVKIMQGCMHMLQPVKGFH